MGSGIMLGSKLTYTLLEIEQTEQRLTLSNLSLVPIAMDAMSRDV